MVNRSKRINFELFDIDLINSIKKHKVLPHKFRPDHIRPIIQKIHTIQSILAGIHIEFHYPVNVETGSELVWQLNDPNNPKKHWKVHFKHDGIDELASKASETDLMMLDPHFELFLRYVSEYLNGK